MGATLIFQKRLLVLIMVFCGLMMLSGCIDSDEKSFQSLKINFLDDYDVINSAVENEQYYSAASLSWIKEVDVKDGYVDYYCGGSGMGSQTNYTGFFFTPNDDPLAMWRANVPDLYAMTASDFVETADGWEYRESDHNAGGDNCYIVKKLAPCYYYYYLHF